MLVWTFKQAHNHSFTNCFIPCASFSRDWRFLLVGLVCTNGNKLVIPIYLCHLAQLSSCWRVCRNTSNAQLNKFFFSLNSISGVFNFVSKKSHSNQNILASLYWNNEKCWIWNIGTALLILLYGEVHDWNIKRESFQDFDVSQSELLFWQSDWCRILV